MVGSVSRPGVQLTDGTLTGHPQATEGTNKSRRQAVVASAVGNMLEWFDFAAYGYFSAVLGRNFFPSDNPYTSILSSFAVFAAAFFMRPLGGVIFGHVGDRYGRKKALVLSAGLMTISTFAIGCLPTYETVGILAPILLVVLRLGQGLSVGGEYTSSAIFLVESSKPQSRGLVGSLVGLGASSGIMAGSILGVVITTLLTPSEVQEWGWRIPFLLGIVLGAFTFVLRRHMEADADIHEGAALSQEQSPLRTAFRDDARNIARAFIMNLAPGASFYIVFVYLVTYMQSQDGIPGRTAFTLNTLALLVLSAAIPVIGMVSDRIGRKTTLAALALGLVLFSWPLFLLIDSSHPALILLGQTGFALLVGGYTAVIPSTLVEMFRRHSRCTAMAVSYNASMALVGGTAPLVAAALVDQAQLPMGPAVYIAAMALLSLGAILTMKDATGKASV